MIMQLEWTGHNVFHFSQLSDWDRFAAEEYELLVVKESGNEQNDQSWVSIYFAFINYSHV